MSDAIEPSGEARLLERRVQRTRAALRAAFNDLILTRGYEAVTAARIAEHADVGRSTFYEHYQNKEDILGQSLAPILTPLADSCLTGEAAPILTAVMAHFWDNRKLARALLSGRARGVVVKRLAELIEQKLACGLVAEERSERVVAPSSIAAAYIANGQLGMIDTWLSGRHGCTAPEIAAALQRGSRAAFKAFHGSLAP